MPDDHIDTLVIGAGQAGIAMSEHLSRQGLAHLVVERHQVAHRWRAERWDGLVANGPAWHDRFPGMEFQGWGPEDFPGKEAVADYFAAYAGMIKAPLRTGVEVTRLTRDADGLFHAETDSGTITARNVVSATGSFQKPLIPALVPDDAGVVQMHSTHYRNPSQLPPGAVLVVGGGSSGTQIADELNRAGRRTYLSLGPHDRPPRRYRGKDFVWWLGALGKWDLPAPTPGREHVTIAVSGAYGGQSIDFRRLAGEGLVLLGRTQAYADGALQIADDLQRNVANGDDYLASLLDECDAYAVAEGLDLPDDPQARRRYPDPDCLTAPIRSLDLQAAGISAIIWATGFAFDYGWLGVDALTPEGRPDHDKGVSPVPGFYFIGLPWLSSRGSSFIWGCWKDAEYLATQIASRPPSGKTL
jgi:putative flavoprotein involved in K+ transport